eukprot:79954_1
MPARDNPNIKLCTVYRMDTEKSLSSFKTKDVLNSSVLLLFDDKNILLRHLHAMNPIQRKDNIKYLLSKWNKLCIDDLFRSSVICHGIRDVVEVRYILQSILQHDFWNNKKELCSALSTITTQFNTTTNQKQKQLLLLHLYRIVVSLTYEQNPLVFKRIITSDSVDIWKPLLLSILTAILSIGPKKVGLIRPGYETPWLYCYRVLMTIIYGKGQCRQLREKQLKFAIEHGCCKLIKKLYIKKQAIRWYMKYEGKSSQIVTHELNLAAGIYWPMQHVIQEKLGKQIYGYWIQELQKEFNRNNPNKLISYAKFYRQMHNGSGRGSYFLSDEPKCGWILCNKWIKKTFRKNKCSGCKLIQYCCRNHQKKHWKYIHSQQCC